MDLFKWIGLCNIIINYMLPQMLYLSEFQLISIENISNIKLKIIKFNNMIYFNKIFLNTLEIILIYGNNNTKIYFSLRNKSLK